MYMSDRCEGLRAHNLTMLMDRKKRNKNSYIELLCYINNPSNRDFSSSNKTTKDVFKIAFEKNFAETISTNKHRSSSSNLTYSQINFRDYLKLFPRLKCIFYNFMNQIDINIKSHRLKMYFFYN